MKKCLFIFLVVSCSILMSCNNKTKSSCCEGSAKDSVCQVNSGKIIPADTFGTSENALYVTMVGHGSLMFEHKGKIIYVDPYSKVADYSKLPKANIILLTHEHFDHFDRLAMAAVKKDDTHFIVSQVCADSLGYGEVLKNGEKTECDGIGFEAIAAYNIVNKRLDGEPYYPKGRGNGYIVTIGDQTLYIGGDTENIPEMDLWKGKIDIAFLPKNLPYTMTDEMFVDAAKKMQPKYLYPYHFSEYDETKISNALEGTNIKLMVRPMSNK